MEYVVTYRAILWHLGTTDEEHEARDAWWWAVEWSRLLGRDAYGEHRVIAVLPSKFDECERLARAANVHIERD